MLRNMDTFKREVVDICDNILIGSGSDISSCIELLNKTLQTLIDKHALIKRTCIKSRPHPWYNNDIHQAKLHLRTCEREWKENKCLSSRSDYVNARNYVTKLIKVHNINYYQDKFLNFHDHITALCRSTHFHIRNIGKIRNLLSYDACSTSFHALIRCRLDYGNYILYNVPKSKTDRLKRLQNSCARILTKSSCREHITTSFEKIKLAENSR